jgi:hypothetical protein
MRMPGMTRVVSVGMVVIRRPDVIVVMGLARLAMLSVGMAMRTVMVMRMGTVMVMRMGTIMVMVMVMGTVMLMAAVTD